MTDEPRILKRRNLVYNLKVYDDETGKFLGYLIDLTTCGIKLLSKQPLPVNILYKLRLMLPDGYFTRKELKFEAQSRWSARDINPDYYATGFSAPQLEVNVQDVFHDLQEWLSFND